MDNNIFQKIQEILGKITDNFSILEETIDIEVQMQYFEFASQIKSELKKEEIIAQKDLLFDSLFDIEEKRMLLVQLANIDSVEVFRTLEQYNKNPDKELAEWAKIALHESRAIIESSLLDENKIFISTGLGGRGNKLRYFALLTSGLNTDFSEAQKQIVKIEFEDNLKKFDAEVEDLKFAERFFTAVILLPIDISVRNAFKAAVDACNTYGSLIQNEFVVSNIKIWSIEEIKKHMDSDNNFVF